MLLLKYAKIYELCEASLSPRFNHFGNVGFFSRLFKGVSEKWLTAMWNKSIGLKTKICSIVSVTGYFYGIAFSNKVSLLVKCIIESMHSNGMWDGCLCVYLWKLNIALFQFYPFSILLFVSLRSCTHALSISSLFMHRPIRADIKLVKVQNMWYLHTMESIFSSCNLHFNGTLNNLFSSLTTLRLTAALIFRRRWQRYDTIYWKRKKDL